MYHTGYVGGGSRLTKIVQGQGRQGAGACLRRGVHLVELIDLDEVLVDPRGEVVDGHSALAASRDVQRLYTELEAAHDALKRVVRLLHEEGVVVVAQRLEKHEV